MISTLEIDGQAIPAQSMLGIDQTYNDIVPTTFRRTADNTGVLRTTGDAKLRTAISGKGWVPPGLAALDLGTTHVLRCAASDTVTSATTSVTVPAARRSDTGHTPRAFAEVGDDMVPTTISNQAAIDAGSSDVASLDAVSGATGYAVEFWPEITAVILVNTAKLLSSATTEWQIEAEQV